MLLFYLDVKHLCNVENHMSHREVMTFRLL